jgi:hypothetical protein
MHNAAACKSPPRASSTLLQHLGLSRLSSPLNTSTASRLRCPSPQNRPRNPGFSYRGVCELIVAGIHVRQVRIPKISVLLEILHPLLQERAAPDMCVSSVFWARRADASTAETAARGSRTCGLQKRDRPCFRHAPPCSSPPRFNCRQACAVFEPTPIHSSPHQCKRCKEGYTYLLIVSLSPITQRCLFGRVIATLSLLFSPKNPTSCSELLRTVLTTTASFSRPWKPSTDPSSKCGYFSFSRPASSASCGV